MADLSITAANVGLTDTVGAVTQNVQVGEAVTQGQPGYLHTDSKYYQTDADAGAPNAAATGIFLTPAAADEYAVFLTSGPVDLGATLTVGETYIVSGTKGGIAPIGDAASGWFKTTLGNAITASRLDVDIDASGVAVP